MEKVLGYDYVDGRLVVNDDEKEVVKEVFAKFHEYTENPPAELVESVLEIALERGEVITYEEAKERVTLIAILEYMAREFNSNPEILEVIRKKQPKYSLRKGADPVSRTSEPIVSKEIWEKAQKKL